MCFEVVYYGELWHAAFYYRIHFQSIKNEQSLFDSRKIIMRKDVVPDINAKYREEWSSCSATSQT